ncbi:MAG: hypothetical protein HYR51_10000 [Candidatus Rokubacteria bacterium]|nr:hypothetical protein [Candidatus Rokubacteria bacterium]
MFVPGKKPCAFCGQRVSKSHAWRAPDRSDGLVCSACYARWEADGRACAECQTAVRHSQEVGAFFERRALGHADCGALKLLA